MANPEKKFSELPAMSVGSGKYMAGYDPTQSTGEANERYRHEEFDSAYVDAVSMVPALANGAALSTVFQGAAVGEDVYMFDAAVEETVQCKIAMPKTWGETVGVRFYWGADSGAGDAVWKVKALGVGDAETIAGSFGSDASVADTFVASGNLQKSPSVNLTIGGNVTGANYCYLEIARDATDGSDTLAVDAQLKGIYIEP